MLDARLLKAQRRDAGDRQPGARPTTGLAQLDGADYIVKSVATREKKRNPVAPFITSTLQQEAARKLRFSVKRTMMLAQRLYEGVELGQGRRGRPDHLHAYRFDARFRRRPERCARVHRTSATARSFCRRRPTSTSRKKDAQDAHEAIRPTSVELTPEAVEQVPGRRRDEALPADLEALRGVPDDAGGLRPDHHRRHRRKGKDGVDYLFRATGSVPKFDGFLKVYEEGKDQKTKKTRS